MNINIKRNIEWVIHMTLGTVDASFDCFGLMFIRVETNCGCSLYIDLSLLM